MLQILLSKPVQIFVYSSLWAWLALGAATLHAQALCPPVERVLTQNGNFDELGIIKTYGSSFTVQVDGDVPRTTYQSTNASSCGVNSYWYMSYDTETSGSLDPTPYRVTRNEWHRVKVVDGSSSDIFYFKPPADNACGGMVPADFVFIVEGGEVGFWDTPCTSVSLSSVYSPTRPSAWCPPAPTSAYVTAPPGSFVHWSHAWHATIPEIFYKVFRSDSLNGTYSYYTSTNTTDKRIVEPGYYVVRAYVDGSESYDSNVVKVPLEGLEP